MPILLILISVLLRPCRQWILPIGLEDVESVEYARLVDVLGVLAAHGTRVGSQLAVQTTADECADQGARLRNLLAALPAGALGVDLHPGQVIASGHTCLLEGA